MINVSENLSSLISEDSRTFRVILSDGLNTYETIRSFKKSVMFPSASVSIGNALSACIECAATDIPVSITGKKIKAEITVLGSEEKLLLGVIRTLYPFVKRCVRQTVSSCDVASVDKIIPLDEPVERIMLQDADAPGPHDLVFLLCLKHHSDNG